MLRGLAFRGFATRARAWPGLSPSEARGVAEGVLGLRAGLARARRANMWGDAFMLPPTVPTLERPPAWWAGE
eukprot:2110125-Alexandrium_andersonii.AAC.1